KWFAEGHTGWVRMNGFNSVWWNQNLNVLAEHIGIDHRGAQTKRGLLGIILPMVDSVDHINETAKRMPGVPIVALIETARGLQRVNSIAAARGTSRLAFGIGDFRRDTGLGGTPTALAYARSQITIASKSAMLPPPVDGPTQGSDVEILTDATAVSVEFGFTGKLCLLPEQTTTINSGLSPSQSDLSWANNFVTEFELSGDEIRNGSDVPRLECARKIIKIAADLG